VTRPSFLKREAVSGRNCLLLKFLQASCLIRFSSHLLLSPFINGSSCALLSLSKLRFTICFALLKPCFYSLVLSLPRSSMDCGNGHRSRSHRHRHRLRQQDERHHHQAEAEQVLHRNMNVASNSPLHERPRSRRYPDLLEMLPRADAPNDYVQSWLSHLAEENPRARRLDDVSIAHGELLRAAGV